MSFRVHRPFGGCGNTTVAAASQDIGVILSKSDKEALEPTGQAVPVAPDPEQPSAELGAGVFKASQQSLLFTTELVDVLSFQLQFAGSVIDNSRELVEGEGDHAGGAVCAVCGAVEVRVLRIHQHR